MTSLADLLAMGQSVWIDHIERDFVKKGALQELIVKGVRGLTSNPAIFQKAISAGDVYDAEIRHWAEQGLASHEIFEKLAIADIQAAADLLAPVYEASQGRDGYVSLEVSPELAHDAEGTIREAKRLHAAVARRNLMIKVPATAAGIPAIRALIAAGIPVNVTLIFGAQHYRGAAYAYIEGLESRLAAGQAVQSIASVASFFVSRMDTAVDPQLLQRGLPQWLGRVAIANAAATYQLFSWIFSGARWEVLAQAGAQRQRLLWASTGTKNKQYADTLYIDSLVGRDTVNTIPPETLAALLDHGRSAAALPAPASETTAVLTAVAEHGIPLEEIIDRLQQEGVAAFQKAYHDLLESIARKRSL